MDYQAILEVLRAEHARVCRRIAAVEDASQGAPAPAKQRPDPFRSTPPPFRTRPGQTCRKRSIPTEVANGDHGIACQRLLALVRRYTVLTLDATAAPDEATRLAAEAAWRDSEEHRLEHGC